MKHRSRHLLFPVSLVFGLWLSIGFLTHASSSREQSIALQAGWNAVFLEVHPAETDPAVLFAEMPVDIVAYHQSLKSPAQFVTDPSADLYRHAGWSVWYAESRADSFLSTLHTITGQQSYLIHATASCTWEASGEVTLPAVGWQAGGFNFVGFSVSAEAPPTFAQFFGGSKAHREGRIYRLSENVWRRVSDPSAEAMRSGEAFWVYCEGSSEYQGPLAVQTLTRHGLLLGEAPDTLTLRNATDHPVTPTLEHVTSGPEAVPLSILVQLVGGERHSVTSAGAPKPMGPWVQTLPPQEAGAAMGVPFEARLEEMTAPRHASLLKISTDLGTEIWVPVLGIRRDLEDR